MVVGDFNGDGILDIATLDSTDENGSIYLGNGNGTFGMVPLSLGLSGVNSGSYLTMAVADFNGDGKLDLAVPLSTGSGGTVAVLLGNGDGTFQEANGSPITFGTLIANAAVGDFNGDGIADLMLGSETSGQDMYVLIGKGDGTFTQPTSPPLALLLGLRSRRLQRRRSYGRCGSRGEFWHGKYISDRGNLFNRVGHRHFRCRNNSSPAGRGHLFRQRELHGKHLRTHVADG